MSCDVTERSQSSRGQRIKRERRERLGTRLVRNNFRSRGSLRKETLGTSLLSSLFEVCFLIFSDPWEPDIFPATLKSNTFTRHSQWHGVPGPADGHGLFSLSWNRRSPIRTHYWNYWWVWTDKLIIILLKALSVFILTLLITISKRILGC